jgi:deoxyribonuclease V
MVAQAASQFQDLLSIQIAIAQQVVLKDPPGDFTSIGAVAQSFSNDVVFSSAIIVDTMMNVIDESIASVKITMPYIAGLLFFREGPAVIAALKKLRTKPDVLIARMWHQPSALCGICVTSGCCSQHVNNRRF